MCLIYLARASGLPWGVSETSSLFWGPRYLLPSESFPTPIYGIGWRSGGLSAIATPRGGGLGPGLSAADGHSLKQHVAQAKHVASGGGRVLRAWRLGHVRTCPGCSADGQGRPPGPVCVGGSQQQCHVLTPHSQTPPPPV